MNDVNSDEYAFIQTYLQTLQVLHMWGRLRHSRSFPSSLPVSHLRILSYLHLDGPTKYVLMMIRRGVLFWHP